MTDPRTWSPGKKMLGLVGVLVVALLVLQGLESLAGRPERSSSGSAESNDGREPIRPILTRVDDWTIDLREGSFNRSRYRFDEADGKQLVDAVYACLEEGIAREFDDHPTTSHREMRRRAKTLRAECSPAVVRDLVPSPVPPAPPTDDD